MRTKLWLLRAMVLAVVLQMYCLKSYSQITFVQQTTFPFPPLGLSSAAWGDYDNDSLPDVILIGDLGGTSRQTYLFHNSGSGFTAVNPGTIPRVADGSVEWGDYNNDGLIDILITGHLGAGYSCVTKIFRNTDSSFVEAYSFTGTASSCAKWGDYDNDGLLDFIVTGSSHETYQAPYNSNQKPISKIFHNTGTGFVEAYPDSIKPLCHSSVDWGDYNHDGLLDILIAGGDSLNVKHTLIYRNTGSGFTLAYSLPGVVGQVYNCSVHWTDFNNDGLLDAFFSGGGTTNLFRNTDTSFVSNSYSNLPTLGGSCYFDWCDYDHDNYPDVAFDGSAGASGYIFHNNSGNNFTITRNLVGMNLGSASFCDYDQDDYPDVFQTTSSGTFLYKNTRTFIQATNLTASDIRSHSFRLSWTNGNGSGRDVFISSSPSGPATPVNGTTYIAYQNFGLGSQIGTSGWYCVYSGKDSSALITGLDEHTTYTVVVCESFGIKGWIKYSTDNSYAINVLTKYAQVINFTSIPGKTYGDAPFTITFSSSSGLPVTVVSLDNSIATISGNTITIHQAGNVQFMATQDGDATYDNADNVFRTLVVNKITLTCQVYNKTIIYGEPIPVPSYYTTGFISGEDSTVLNIPPVVTNTANSSSGVGSYSIIASGASDVNYNFVYNNGILIINKALLTATANDTSKTYGSANPVFTISYTGFVKGENAGVLTSAPTCNCNATIYTPAGNADITLSGGLDDNYNFAYVNGILIITKAILTYTADAKTKLYGEINPDLTYSIAGFVNSDSISDLDIMPVISTTAQTMSNVGKYPITISGGSDSNYNFSFVNDTLTITKATPTQPVLLSRTPVSNIVCAVTGLSAAFINGTGGAGCHNLYEYSTDSITWHPYVPESQIYTVLTRVYIRGMRGNCDTLNSNSPVNWTLLASWTLLTPIIASLNPSEYTGGNNISCYGYSDGNINLTVTGSAMDYGYPQDSCLFEWSNSQNSRNIDRLRAGNYSVIITDHYGCRTTVSQTLNQPEVLSLSTIPIAISCNGLPDGGIDATISGGTPGYHINWSNGAITEDISGLAIGTYTINVTDTNACAASMYVTVSEPQPLIAVIDTASNYNGFAISCIGASDGILSVNTTGGRMPYTYKWNTNDATQIIRNLVAGSYSVIVTDAANCVTTDSFELHQPDSLLVQELINNPLCAGENSGSISVKISGGTGSYIFQWSSGSTNSIASDLSEGDYQLLVKDNNNCTVTRSYTLTEPPAIVITDSTQQPWCAEIQDGKIFITIQGGTGTYTYLWDDGFQSEDRTSIGFGSHWVSVTDSAGCSITDSIVLTAQRKMCLDIPDALSPNGDGKNESWKISASGQSDHMPLNIAYPDAIVTIYNRWGNKVFTSERGYPVEWNGSSNGNKLPIDTYYYTIDLKDGSSILTGIVLLLK
jgi:gliding motility-associated-like protein